MASSMNYGVMIFWLWMRRQSVHWLDIRPWAALRFWQV